MGYFNYDFKPHLGVEGEFHFIKDGPSNIYQKTYEIGGRYYSTYGKWVPYGKVLYGRGVFNFASGGVTYANLAYNLVAGESGSTIRRFPTSTCAEISNFRVGSASPRAVCGQIS